MHLDNNHVLTPRAHRAKLRLDCVTSGVWKCEDPSLLGPVKNCIIMDGLPGPLQHLRLDGPPSVVHVVTRERRFSDVDGARAAADLVHISGQTRYDLTRRPDHLEHDVGDAAGCPPPTNSSTPLPPHRCPSDSSECSVSQVLCTPELLAIVLGFLDTTDILAMRFVNQTFARTVIDSPGLRAHLFLRPQWLRPPADYMLLDVRIPGLSIKRGDPVDMGQWIDVTIDAKAARIIRPAGRPSRPRARSINEGLRSGLGSSAHRLDSWPATASQDSTSPYEGLQVTQPPLLGMQAFMLTKLFDGANPPLQADDHRETAEHDQMAERAEDEMAQEPDACAKLSCHSGITLDFIAETALTLLSEQREAQEPAGSKVLFRAILSFCEPAKIRMKRGTARSVIRLGW